jgi:THO complex subunit 2
MQIRNALLILTRIIDYFPMIKKLGTLMEHIVIKLKEDEREDLKVLATRYHAMLSAKKSSWISEEAFHLVKAPPPVGRLSKPKSDIMAGSEAKYDSITQT